MDNINLITEKSDFIVHTFGCKVNTYDSGLIQNNLKQNLKLDAENKKPRIHVLNTCAVTAEATQQAIRMVRKIKAGNPFSTVIVTGCAAQVDTEAFRNLSGADLVVANSHKGLLPQIIDQYFKGEIKEKVFKSNIFHKEDLEAGGGTESHHTRSFLKIQDGCNSFCTFCIIPYARGKSRSIPISQIVDKINQLEKDGLKEVVLTGVHIGDYEDQSLSHPRNLEVLVETILKETQILRIRLSSLEPIEITEGLLSLYKNSRLCPHFHMSIQSADTDVLLGMKRKYTALQVQHSLQTIARLIPNVFIGMDVIAGFPSETDEQFENTYKVLVDTPWTRLHVFPYSERQGTRAANLQQIPFSIRKKRAARLRDLSLHRLQSESLKQIGKIKNILILNGTAKKYDGLSEDYWSVKILNEEPLKITTMKNQIAKVRIENIQLQNAEIILLGSLFYD